MKHNKKIFKKKQYLRWIAIIAITIAVFFQGYSLVQYYDYLSEILHTVLNDKFEQAVEQYRTSKLKSLKNTFSIEFNPNDDKENDGDTKSDYRADRLSFDKLMYKLTSHAISPEELNIDELDSIYKIALLDDNLRTDFEIIVYKTRTDSVIAQTSNSRNTQMPLHNHSLRKEIDSGREAQVFFRNPVSLIFQKMFLYLIFSGVMLIAVVVSLIYQMQIIFKQKKIEQIRQDFTDSVVHELRNPLQGALSMAELIENEKFSQNAKRRNEVIDRIKGNLSDLSQLLNSLTERSLSENIQIEANWESGNLAIYLNEIIENTTISANKPVRFTTSFIPEINRCEFDHIHLPNALKNLVENALKYSGSEVSIDITATTDGVFFHISLSDNGFGIDKEDLPHIFTKFYRGNSVKNKNGFGLGLSYVKWVTELHNGQIKVISHKNAGSKFTISIPIKTN